MLARVLLHMIPTPLPVYFTHSNGTRLEALFCIVDSILSSSLYLQYWYFIETSSVIRL